MLRYVSDKDKTFLHKPEQTDPTRRLRLMSAFYLTFKTQMRSGVSNGYAILEILLRKEHRQKASALARRNSVLLFAVQKLAFHTSRRMP